MNRQMAGALAAWGMVAGMMVGCTAPEEQATPPPEVARNVRVLSLAPVDLQEYFEISGPMQPVRATDVSAEEGGTVVGLPHDKGDYVRPGDVLVRLDRRLLEAQVEAAATSLKMAEYNAEQTRRLHEAGKVSRIQALSADAQAGQARAALRIATLRHQRAAVPAPFAGLVANRYVELGQLVAPGQPVVRIVDPSTLKLAGTLTEREVDWLEVGAAAQVRLDGRAQPVAGRVGWIAYEADPRTAKFLVEVHVDNSGRTLRPGVMGRATIHKRTHRRALVVPRDAVLQGGEGHSVYVVEGDRAHRRLITLGADQGMLVIVDGGLSAGDQVVVRGHRELIEGALVRITERATARDGSIPGDPPESLESSAAPRGVAAERSAP